MILSSDTFLSEIDIFFFASNAHTLTRAQYQYFKSLMIGWFIKFFMILLTSLVIGVLRCMCGSYDWLCNHLV